MPNLNAYYLNAVISVLSPAVPMAGKMTDAGDLIRALTAAQLSEAARWLQQLTHSDLEINHAIWFHRQVQKIYEVPQILQEAARDLEKSPSPKLVHSYFDRVAGILIEGVREVREPSVVTTEDGNDPTIGRNQATLRHCLAPALALLGKDESLCLTPNITLGRYPGKPRALRLTVKDLYRTALRSEMDELMGIWSDDSKASIPGLNQYGPLPLLLLDIEKFDDETLYLEDLRINRDLRRRGIGTALHEKLLDAARLLDYRFLAFHLHVGDYKAVLPFFAKSGAFLLSELKKPMKSRFRRLSEKQIVMEMPTVALIRFLDDKDAKRWVDPERIGVSLKERIDLAKYYYDTRENDILFRDFYDLPSPTE
ncbi:MAG TPA: GNAT family N-acetyltransferase [bacterium]|nr:GNAT family N-acetyltransferase [bacterium]